MTSRQILEDTLAELRKAFTDADPPVKAQLAGQIRMYVKDLEALGGEKAGEVSTADEIAARREARVTGTADSASASRRSQSRRRGGSNRAG